jgi:CHAT domain-containing protein
MLLGDEAGFRATTEEVFKTGKNLDKSTASSMWADVAVHHLRRKELDQADDAGKKVMELADGAVEDDARAGARDLLARIRFEQKRYREAVEAAEGAIAFWTKRGDVNQLSAWVLAAKAHLALGEREAAYKALREGVRCGELARASAGGTERQVALLFEPAAEAYSMLVDLLVEDHQPREALLVAENAKARTLLDILDGVRSTAESDAPAAMLREERRLEKQLVAANVGGAPSAITRARLDLETYRSIVDADRPQLHAARGAGDLRSVDALAPLLPGPRAALVEFVICEKRLHIFIVRRGRGAPRVDVRTIRIARKTLEQLATRHADALAQYSLAYESGARRLYEILLAPVVRVAPQARDLCIIPDGALWRVPFESLLDGHGGFAVESRAFFYAPSAAVLLREHAHEARPGRKDHQFLGFGDPLLEVSPRETLTTRERGAGSAPIPEAAREVETIARIIGPQASTVFTGANALESRLKAEARDFRIVHLATHGVIDDANPMYSHLLLARHEGDGEDGVLEAREMLGLSLQADLVVLSACDTARGGVHDGEGLIGMSWALFAAGSPSVIASQWRVDSARTETLMTAFYRVWMNDPHTAFAKAHALRAARLALLYDPEFQHPYYWAPFVLIGSGD